MEHQNWDYTVYNDRVKGEKKTGEKAVNNALQQGKQVETIAKNKTNQAHSLTGAKIHKALEADEYVVQTVSLEFKIALQQARTAKGKTQKDLATAINEKQSVVNDYEAGRAIPDNNIISKIERVLGCKLPRQKKTKKTQETE